MASWPTAGPAGSSRRKAARPCRSCCASTGRCRTSASIFDALDRQRIGWSPFVGGCPNAQSRSSVEGSGESGMDKLFGLGLTPRPPWMGGANLMITFRTTLGLLAVAGLLGAGYVQAHGFGFGPDA